MRDEGVQAAVGSADEASLPLAVWRSDVRPQVLQAEGDVLCDLADPLLIERVVLHTPGRVHVRGQLDAVAELRRVHADRLVVHANPVDAWATAAVGVAVLEAGVVAHHRDALLEVAPLRADRSPVVVVTGPMHPTAEAALLDLAASGWDRRNSAHSAILTAPPSPVGANGSSITFTPRASGDETPNLPSPAALAGDDADAGGLSELETRLTAIEIERDSALRRQAAAEDLVSALRLFLDETRDALAAERRHSADLLEQRDHQHGRAQRFKAEAAVLRQQLDEREVQLQACQAVMEAAAADLERVTGSQAWKIGHGLARAARLLTFRKPGSSNGIASAIDRLRHGARPPASR